ncbi:hypothetical protein FACS1894171_2150 [Clostridia bacterium]|nr:hypothetical protein FACS1894171_2150 [Clostridia bacterium]
MSTPNCRGNGDGNVRRARVTIPVSVHATNGTKSGDITYDVTVKYTRTAADSSYTNAVAITAEKERIETVVFATKPALLYKAAGNNAPANQFSLGTSLSSVVLSLSSTASIVTGGNLSNTADMVPSNVTVGGTDPAYYIQFNMENAASAGNKSDVTIPLLLTLGASTEVIEVTASVEVDS